MLDLSDSYSLSNATIPAQEDVEIRRLAISNVFRQLSLDQKLYAHHLCQYVSIWSKIKSTLLNVCRASWTGAKIIHEQVSPESPSIFNLILELHHSCQGDWTQLLHPTESTTEDKSYLDQFIAYAALFLFNHGNFYGYGDQKFVPGIPPEFLARISQRSTTKAQELLQRCVVSMLSPRPSSLGFPGVNTQS